MAFVVTAVAAAIEVTTFATVMTAVSAVGMATSVVGLVTGNKDLMKIGGVLGLAGGIGSLASSAMGAAEGVAGESLASLGGASDSFLANGMGSALATDSAAGLGAGIEAANAGADFGASTFSVPDPSSGFSDPMQSSFSDARFDAMANDGGVLNNAMSPTPSVSTLNSPMQNAPMEPVTPNAPVQNVAPPEPTPTADPMPTANVDPMSGGPAGNGNTYSDIRSGPSGADPTVGGTTTNYGGVAASNNVVDGLKAKLGALWNGLSKQTQAEMIKSAMAIPGGIQKQKNEEAALALQQQKVNQTSYGSSVPKFGIINTARG